MNNPESKMGTRKEFCTKSASTKDPYEPGRAATSPIPRAWDPGKRTYPREVSQAVRINRPRPGWPKPIFQEPNAKPAAAPRGFLRRFGILAGHVGFQPRPQ